MVSPPPSLLIPLPSSFFPHPSPLIHLPSSLSPHPSPLIPLPSSFSSHPSVLCSLNPLPHSFSHHLSSPRLPLISLSSSLFPNFYVPILLLPLSPLISFPYSWHFTHVPSSLPLIPLPSSFNYLPSSLFFIPPLTPYSPSFDPRHCPHSSAPLFLSLFPNISPPPIYLTRPLFPHPFPISLSSHLCLLILVPYSSGQNLFLSIHLFSFSLSFPGRSTLRYSSAPLLEKY